MIEHPPSQVPCSILVPVYNAEQYLYQGLASIAASARDIDQIVLVDDGSTDGTSAIIQKFAKRDSRITYLLRDHFGLVNTLNFGMRFCEFELIARADIDDLYASNRIELLSNFLTSNPKVGAVFSDYRIFGKENQFLGDIYSAITPKLTQLSLISSSRTAHPAVMFRKSLVLDLGGYKEENYPTEDLALWISISKESEIASFPRALLAYTLNASGISSQYQSKMKSNLRIFQHSLVQSIDLMQVQNELSNTFSIYSLQRGSAERHLSLLRDLMIFSRICDRKMKLICLKLIGELLLDVDKSWIKSAVDMRKFQILRENYRRGLFK